MFVAYEILVILHHLARILVAELVGLKLLAFACGPFAIRRIRNRTRFTLEQSGDDDRWHHGFRAEDSRWPSVAMCLVDRERAGRP